MSISAAYEPELLTGDGSETDFDFDFRIFNSTDLVVALVDPDTLVATAQTLTTHYTVVINTVTPGGTVTFLTAPEDGVLVSIRRDVPITQETDIPSGGLFREAQIENALDKQTLVSQQLKELIDRSVVQSPYQTALSLTMPVAEANKVLGWNAAATGLENKNPMDADSAASAATSADEAELAASAAETAQIAAESAASAAQAAQTAAEEAATSVTSGAFDVQIDGGGAVIATGIIGDVYIPFDLTLTGYTLLGANSPGAIKIDIWKAPYASFPPTNADSICNGHEPTIAATATAAQDLDISDWSGEAVTAGSVLRFNVDSCTTLVRALLSLNFTRT